MLVYQRVNPIPSGKLSQNELERSTMLFSWVNYGKIHHAEFSWQNQLFRLGHGFNSFVLLNYQTVNPIPSGKLSQNELERSTMLFSWVNYGKIHHAEFSWQNQLFRLGHGFNSCLLNYQRVPSGKLT